jgi:mannose-1-phosphate guanylyltransferase
VDDTFVVVNGDVLTDFDVTGLVKLHRERAASCTVGLTPVSNPSAFGIVVTDDDGKVETFVEKPAPGTEPSNLANAGIYVVEPEVVDRIPDGRRVSIERETFPLLAAEGGLYAFASDAYWLDTGTPLQYLAAQLDIVAGRRPAAALPDAVEIEPGVHLAPGAVCDGRRYPPCWVGAGATVAAGAEVSVSIVSSGSQVGRGAVVRGSALLPGARVAEGALVEASVVGPGAVVGPRSVVRDGTVVGPGAVVPAGADLAGERFPSTSPA